MLDMLDVAIGITFYFLLVSIVTMAATEIVELGWKKRRTYLERGINALLQDPSGTGLARLLHSHPLIQPLRLGPPKGNTETGSAETNQAGGGSSVSTSRPSYLPPRDFALALLDLVGLTQPPESAAPTAKGEPLTVASLAARLQKLKEPADLPPAIQQLANESGATLDDAAIAAISNALRPLLADVGSDIGKARRNIEDWYNSQMNAVSGWYTRHARKVTLATGFALVALINADAVFLVRALSQNDDLREAYVAAAQAYVDEAADASSRPSAPATAALPPPADTTAQADAADPASTTPADSTDDFARAVGAYEDAVAQIETLGVPLGWARDNPSAQWPGRVPASEAAFTAPGPGSSLGWWWVMKVIGLAVTGIAISLGAPFWFDLLNKFMVVRSTVKPNEKTQPEDSEDRATPVNPLDPPALSSLIAQVGSEVESRIVKLQPLTSPPAPADLATLLDADAVRALSPEEQARLRDTLAAVSADPAPDADSAADAPADDAP